MFSFTYTALIIFSATIVNLIAVYVSWQRRTSKDGWYFVLAMVGITIWTMASSLDYAAVTIPLKVFFAQLEVVGYHVVLTFFTMFVLSYTGNEEWLKRNWVKALVIVIPLTNILLVWTNGWHHWVWTGFENIPSGDHVIVFQRGPAIVWIALTGYLMISVSLVNLWQAARKGSDISRRQARSLFLAALFPVLTNLLYWFGVGRTNGVDWTPVTFSVTGVLFLYTLYSTNLLNIVPIARDQVIGGLSDGVIVLDMQNLIIDVNIAAVRMLGLQPADLVGKEFSQVPLFPPALMEHPVEQEIRIEVESDTEGKQYFDVLRSPLYDGNNSLLGSFITFHDITERKKNELRLLQLTQAVAQSPTSVVITDLQGNIQYVNPHFSTLTGYTEEEAIGKKTSIVKSGLTPGDVYKDMWQTILSGHPWRGEFLNRKKNGELYWEQAIMSPVIDASGNLVNFIAVKEDITQRKQAEDALRLSEARFRQLVMSAPDAVLGVDAAGDIVFVNLQATRLLGYEEGELIGRNVEVLVPEGLRDQHVNHRSEYSITPNTRSMAMGRELSARRKDGTEIPVEINLGHSLTEKGTLVIAHMRDVTRRKRAEDALRSANQQLESQLHEIETLQSTLREQAIRDPLTHLHNRRFLNEAIEQEFHHAKRSSESLSFILLDIDNFKSINDSFGHLAGDTCLIALANLLQRGVRKSDICCRYGGEEFMLVLPATGATGAAHYAERLRRLVASEVIHANGQEIRFTVSVGISSFPQHGETYGEIINKADEALYASKHAGRNRVTIWSEGDGRA